MTTVITAAVLAARLIIALGFLPTAVAEDKNPSDPAPKAVPIAVTAYSSSPDETDSTPFITASGKTTGDGILANNCLPFGTEVKIPELFGEKIFVVEDRKHSRYSCNWLDVWYPTKAEAKKFGIKKEIEALVF